MKINKILQQLRENNKTSFLVCEGLTIEYYKCSNKDVYEVLDDCQLFARNTNNKHIGLTLVINNKLLENNIIHAYKN